MKNKYESFTLLTKHAKTVKGSQWSVNCNETGYRTGIIAWFTRWKKLAFFPNDDTVFNEDCLTEIAEFIKKVSKK